jgi:hypothetical protein
MYSHLRPFLDFRRRILFNAGRALAVVTEVVMEPTSRRKFLRNTSVAVAAAGVASAVPLTAAQALADTPPPIPDDESADAPVVAHVRNLRKGEVVLYTGEREVLVSDKRLASLLYHASR